MKAKSIGRCDTNISTMKMNKKYGIIDIGSNSVRGRAFADGKIIYNELFTTRLGSGLANGSELTEKSMQDTVKAIKNLVGGFKKAEVGEIYAFATEAVRSATNGKNFVGLVKNETGIDVDVVNGDEEGELALLGAVGDKDGAVIDVGGASAEISAVKDKKIIYSHSLPLGAVRLYGKCGDDENKLKNLVDARIVEYGKVPTELDFYAVGGTATTLAALNMRLDKYDENKVDGYVLTRAALEKDYALIAASDRQTRIEKLRIQEKRADIIGCGAYLLLEIMRTFGIEKVTVKESDNLLGYMKKRFLGESYARE